MIVVDYNHTAISSLMGGAAQMKRAPHDMGIEFFRHMVLNALRSYRTKFNALYEGEMVIACDHPHTWRRDVFPPYKKNRSRARTASTVDWKTIHEWMTTVQNELREEFPYVVLQHEGAEADDIIAAIVRTMAVEVYDKRSTDRFLPEERLLIVSGDTDFIQLQDHQFVDQFTPVKGQFARLTGYARQVLKQHVLEGDVGDGIPNALSGDNVLITPGARQTPLRGKIREAAMQAEGGDLFDIAPYFGRNNTLINLLDAQHPALDEQIIGSLHTQLNTLTAAEKSDRRRRLLNYLIRNRMKLLTEHLGEF